jgi:hypothetical protein
MAVHRRRGYGVAQKEVKRETRLGVTDPSRHALTFYTFLEARKKGVVSAVLSGVIQKLISFCAETAHATARKNVKL